MNDLKFAFRQLLKNPGFTAVAVLSLSLGIGACTSVFSIVNAVLLRSLPVPDPQELRLLNWAGSEVRMRSITGRSKSKADKTVAESVSMPVYEELRRQAKPVAELFGFAPLNEVAVRARREAFSASGMIVSDNFFSGLGVRPFVGRVFTPDEADPEATQQVVISASWWERQFSSDPAILGQSLTLNGSLFTIIGVLPRGFSGIDPGVSRDFYVAMTPQSQFLDRAVSEADHWWVRMMARVPSSASAAELKAKLDVSFARDASMRMKEPEIVFSPGNIGLDYESDTYRKPLLLMLSIVGLVMLVACANLAGLSLARGAVRQHEMSIRSALGSGRWRLVRQSLIESLVLALAGSSLGGLLAYWGTGAVARLLAGATGTLAHNLSPDLTVLAFTIAAGLMTALLSGLLPALRAGGSDPLGGLKARNALAVPRLRAGRILVVSQVALSLLLLVGAGLFVRTLTDLRKIDVGFDTSRLLVFRVNAPGTGRTAQTTSFYEEVQSRLAALPGVANATLTVMPLLYNNISFGGFRFVGRADQNDGQEAYRMVVGERFFDTLGMSILKGRSLSSADRANSSKVLVVNETFAKRYFPGESPIGRSIGTWRAEWEIVGVCSDIRYQNIKEAAPPTIYVPFRQFPMEGAHFMVRTRSSPLEMATAVRKTVADVDSAVPVAMLATQEQLIDGTIGTERLSATMCAILAGFALLLACIGLYGLMAYNVARRRGEIAVRLAIGAQRGEISRAVLGEALALTGIGIGIALPLVYALNRLLQSQLDGWRSADFATLSAVAGTLLVVAMFSAWLPAFRASKTDPMVALRAE